MTLRGTLNQNWVSARPEVVKSLNNTPLKKLGWLTPTSIHSEIDTAHVQKSQEVNNIKVYKEPSFQIQRKNQLENEQNLNFQVNDFVYLDFDEKLFDKSFNVSVSQKLHSFAS